MNPYEAPQTIDTPPPVAEEVLVTTVDYAALAEAAGECSRAGKYYLIMTLLTAFGFLGLSMMPWELRDTLWMLLPSAPFLGGLLFFVCGILLNTWACGEFKLKLPDLKLQKLYASCQRASWLKAVLVIYLPFIPIVSHTAGQPGSGYAAMWNFLMCFVPAIVLVINSIVTVIQHFRGLNELGEMIQYKKADELATLYLFSGVPTTLIVVVVFLLSLGGINHHAKPPFLLAVVPLLMLPMLAAYQVAYRRLSQEFLARAS